MRKLAFLLCLLPSLALAAPTSTVQVNVPITGTKFTSQIFHDNWQKVINDINALWIAVTSVFTSTTSGVVPATGGVGATFYLDATGNWSIPSGGGGGGSGTVTNVSVVGQNNGLTLSVANPSTTPQFTISGVNLTPSSLSATGNITSQGSVGIGTSVPDSGASLDIGQKTNSLILPAGNTSQRPGTPKVAMLRYNSDLVGIEAYYNSQWNTLGTSGGGGTSSLSGLTAATANNTINNASFAQTWNWNSLTTQTALALASTSVTTGTLLSVSDTGATAHNTASFSSSSSPAASAVVSISNTSTSGNGGKSLIVTNSAPNTLGILVQMSGTTNTGTSIRGENNATSGTNIAVEGLATSVGLGVGIFGTETGSSNTGYAVEAINNSASGWGIYSSGTSPNYMKSVLSIGTTVPTTGTSLDLGSNTNSMLMPVGTVGQRPTGVAGMLRYNSTSGQPEVFGTSQWNPIAGYAIRSVTVTTDTITSADNGALVAYDNATAAVATTLNAASSYGANFVTDYFNEGPFSVTISAASTINGIGSSLKIHPNTGCTIGSNGTTFDPSACTAALNLWYPQNDSTIGASLALGNGALESQSGASAAYFNTAIGYQALGNSTLTTAAVRNAAIGFKAFDRLTSGTLNTGIGYLAGHAITTGNSNMCIGEAACGGATTATGNNNAIVGPSSFVNPTTAAGNTIIGADSGINISTGNLNTIIGQGMATATLTTGSGNILIGNGIDTPLAGTSNTLNIGNEVFGVNIGTTGPQIGIGTSTPNTGVSFDMGSLVDSLLLPSGTTGQRPTGIAGMLRYNSTVPQVEAFYSSAWHALGGGGSSNIGSGTFASRPTASTNTGVMYYATDLGTNGAVIISNGTYWKPVTGEAIIYQSGVKSTIVTGSTTETLTSSTTIPAGLVSANGSLEMVCIAGATGTAGTKTYKLYWNSASNTNITTNGIINAAFSATQISGDVRKMIFARNATNSQISTGTGDAGFQSSTGANITSTIDTTLTTFLNWSVTLANSADSAYLEGCYVAWREP